MIIYCTTLHNIALMNELFALLTHDRKLNSMHSGSSKTKFHKSKRKINLHDAQFVYLCLIFWVQTEKQTRYK